MIPIFRAKRLYSDEYVFGVPRQDSKGMFEMIINVVEDGIPGVIQRYIEVDTISIHFPDMLDSQSNKIFASLQKDGKGGDICESKWFNTDVRLTVETESVRYSNSTMIQDGYNISRYEYKKIIGIQQWNQIQYKKNI